MSNVNLCQIYGPRDGIATQRPVGMIDDSEREMPPHCAREMIPLFLRTQVPSSELVFASVSDGHLVSGGTEERYSSLCSLPAQPLLGALAMGHTARGPQ